MSTVVAVCTSDAKGAQKHAVDSVLLVRGHGIQGDAHAGSWHRQVSLLNQERIEELKRQAAGRGQPLQLEAGAFGENIVTRGLDLAALNPGCRFLLGSQAGAEAVLQITQIGKECHAPCAISRQAGTCIMPGAGVFARVVRGGMVRAGDLVATSEELDRLRYAVLTVSDKGSRGERVDEGGPLVCALLNQSLGDQRVPAFQVRAEIIADERSVIERRLSELADQDVCDLIVTTGGTGLSPRDMTPEATLAVVDRQIPGMAEAMRAAGLAHTPHAMLSRAVCGLRGSTIIVNLSGSPKAVREQLSVLLPVLPHAIRTATGIPADCARK